MESTIGSGKKFGCSCKSSKCSQKYCECFSNGLLCDPSVCSCQGCLNGKELSEEASKFVESDMQGGISMSCRRVICPIDDDDADADAEVDEVDVDKRIKRARKIEKLLPDDWEELRWHRLMDILEGRCSGSTANLTSSSSSSAGIASSSNAANKASTGSSLGCKCVKSKCTKKYCECFQSGKKCIPGICSCKGCENCEIIENDMNLGLCVNEAHTKTTAIQQLQISNPLMFSLMECFPEHMAKSLSPLVGSDSISPQHRSKVAIPSSKNAKIFSQTVMSSPFMETLSELLGYMELEENQTLYPKSILEVDDDDDDDDDDWLCAEEENLDDLLLMEQDLGSPKSNKIPTTSFTVSPKIDMNMIREAANTASILDHLFHLYEEDQKTGK